MRILPKPMEVTIGTGKTKPEKGMTVYVANELLPLKKAIEKKLASYSPLFTTETEAFLSFLFDAEKEKEEYELTVDENGAKIQASRENGAFYGMMTFLQLIYSGQLPYCHVKDKPRFSYRGFMLDVARHFFGKEEIKQVIDNMAYYKLNTFHWHLTEDQGWRIEIKKYPELSARGSVRKSDWLNIIGTKSDKPYGENCYFTQDDVREIVAYATENYVQVIPEIDMPGHLTSALHLFPQLSCEKKPLDVSDKVGVKDTVGCIGNPDFIAFTHDILDEVCALFPSPFVHIGGDEVPRTKWKNCPVCQQFMKDNGIPNESNLQGWFTEQTMNYLKAKGKATIGWDEIMDCDELPPETVVQWWRGKNKKPLQWMKKGGRTILSMCNVCYLDYPYFMTTLEKVYNLAPELLEIDRAEQANIIGVEAPLWTEFVYDKKKMDFQIYPRMQALAETAWTQANLKNYADFTARLASFFPQMKEQGIVFCPPKKYNPKGLKGLRQKWLVGKRILRNPDAEMDF